PRRHRRELPEIGDEGRMRVGRKSAAGMAVFLAETVELVSGQPAFQECARVDTGRGVTLDEDLVSAAGMGFAPEEVVEPDLVERRRRRVGGYVSAHPDAGTLRAVHHDCGVPPDPEAVASVHLL